MKQIIFEATGVLSYLIGVIESNQFASIAKLKSIDKCPCELSHFAFVDKGALAMLYIGVRDDVTLVVLMIRLQLNKLRAILFLH